MKRNTIIILALIFSIAGIARNFWFTFDDTGQGPGITTLVLHRLTPYYFNDVFQVSIMQWGEYFYSVNLFSVYLCSSFFIAALIYLFSRSKEIRLLRFNFALILLGKLIFLPFLLSNLLAPVKNDELLPRTVPDPWMNILSVGVLIIFVFVATQALFFLKKDAPLELSVEPGPDNVSKEYLLPATKWQRSLNHIIDSILIVVYIYCTVHTSFHFPPVYAFLKNMEEALGRELSLITILIMARSLYFFLFEMLFASSPGKMLTQTRVTDVSGNRPPFKALLGRTLARSIPFEAFTFLTGYNLHDKISDTYVVRETQKGVSPLIYLWIMLPLFLIITLATFSEPYLR